MASDPEVELKHIKSQVDRMGWSLDKLGFWPNNRSTSAQRKFVIFTAYFFFHFSLQMLDLASVIHSLQLVVANLTQSGYLSIAMIRMLTIRFNKTAHRIMNAIGDDLTTENFEDPEEIKILRKYADVTDRFYRLAAKLVGIATVLYFFTPLQAYLITRMINGTAVLKYPFRIYTFIDLSTIERKSIVYALQFPMEFTSICLVMSYSIIMACVMNICGRLAVLTYKITTMNAETSNPRIVFRRHTEQHIKIMMLSQWLNDGFRVPLLYDLIASTVLMGLVVYEFLIYIDDADVFGIIRVVTYILLLTVLGFTNCFMGESLQTQCTALLNAYYECDWYEMSAFHRKGLMICMEMSQKPMQLMAGKFYVFSLGSFTQIMKSSMVYVSMLRTLI